GVTGDVHIGGRIEGNRVAPIVRTATEEGGVEELRARGAEFRDEHVVRRPAAERRIDRAGGDRGVRGVGPADDIGVARAVDGNRMSLVRSGPFYEREMSQGAPR